MPEWHRMASDSKLDPGDGHGVASDVEIGTKKIGTVMHYKSRERLNNAGSGCFLRYIFYVMKWFFPMIFGGCGFYLQSVLLHWATYNYVHRHEKIEALIGPDLMKTYQQSYETVPDPLSDLLGPTQFVAIGSLDLVAGFFPGAFIFGTMFLQFLQFMTGKGGCSGGTVVIGSQSLQVWTKVFLCAGILFTLKGLLDAMTMVPDSSGWLVCKARLEKDGPEGLEYMKEEHTFSEMFFLDFTWIIRWHHHPLRYCADMMYSGHTFVVTLFALGCYEMLRVVIAVREANPVDEKDKKRCCRTPKNWRIIVKSLFLTALAVLAIGEQLVEIYFVLLSRFHYSMDVVVALVVTFLLYTNGAVAVFAKQWELRGPLYLIGRWPTVYQDKKPLACTEDEWKQQEMWVTEGDIFVPFCCFPFCCLAGRQHIYSDKDLLAVGKQLCDGQSGIDWTKLEKVLNLREGLSLRDVEDMMAGESQLIGTQQPPRSLNMDLEEPLLKVSASANSLNAAAMQDNHTVEALSDITSSIRSELGQRIEALELKADKLHISLGGRIDQTAQKGDENILGIYDRVSELEQRLSAVQEDLRCHVDELEERVRSVESSPQLRSRDIRSPSPMIKNLDIGAPSPREIQLAHGIRSREIPTESTGMTPRGVNLHDQLQNRDNREPSPRIRTREIPRASTGTTPELEQLDRTLNSTNTLNSLNASNSQMSSSSILGFHTVEFTVSHDSILVNQVIAVVGESMQLGNWCPSEAPKLNQDLRDRKLWIGKVQFPSDAPDSLEYKLVIMPRGTFHAAATTWEQHENRRLYRAGAKQHTESLVFGEK